MVINMGLDKRMIEEICSNMHASDCDRCPIPAIFKVPPSYVRCNLQSLKRSTMRDEAGAKKYWKEMREESSKEWKNQHP